MGGEANKNLKKLICAGMVILAVAGCATAPAAIVTTTYEFLPDQSNVEKTWGHQTYSVEGQFQLTVDFDGGIASFDQVDATISEEIRFVDYYLEDPISTDSLDVLFHMTEMVSTSVSDTAVEFVFEKSIPTFPGADVNLTVTFVDDSIHLVGWFYEPVFDGTSYYLDAIAVPEPATFFLLGLGGLMLKKRK